MINFLTFPEYPDKRWSCLLQKPKHQCNSLYYIPHINTEHWSRKCIGTLTHMIHQKQLVSDHEYLTAEVLYQLRILAQMVLNHQVILLHLWHKQTVKLICKYSRKCSEIQTDSFSSCQTPLFVQLHNYRTPCRKSDALWNYIKSLTLQTTTRLGDRSFTIVSPPV